MGLFCAPETDHERPLSEDSQGPITSVVRHRSMSDGSPLSSVCKQVAPDVSLTVSSLVLSQYLTYAFLQATQSQVEPTHQYWRSIEHSIAHVASQMSQLMDPTAYFNPLIRRLCSLVLTGQDPIDLVPFSV